MKSLAYFSPFLPALSGIAVYSHEILQELKNYFDITLVSDDKCDEKGFKIISFAKFYETSSAYDYALYNIGNHLHFHAKIYEAMMKIPGVVILHDFFIFELMPVCQNLEDEAYYCHGLKARVEHFFNAYKSFGSKYPLNRRILENARVCIAHTQKSLELAKKFYNNDDVFELLLLPRKLSYPNKLEAKKSLGFEGKCLYCSFGLLHDSKMNYELLEAWDLTLKNDDRFMLIFAGGSGDDEYFIKINNFIKENNIKNVKITGWLNSDEYNLYQAAADISVQLRKEERGESSGAILDCFNNESLVIANFSDYKAQSLYIDDISKLKNALSQSKEILNTDKFKNIIKSAKEKIINEHSTAIFASNLAGILERAYQKPFKMKNILKARILIDISAIYITDARTGISRVVWQELNALIKVSHLPVHVVAYDNNLKSYKFVDEFILKAHGVAFKSCLDGEVIPQNGDIFYGLDFAVLYGDEKCELPVLQAYKNGFFDKLKKAGAKAYFRVYDLLPLTNPQFFPFNAARLHLSWLDTLKNINAHLIAISNRVYDDLMAFGIQNASVIRLGSHFKISNSAKNKNKIKNFLMVGTIEERKAQKAVALSFLRLASQGIKARLIIAGRIGRVDDDFKKFLAECECGVDELLNFKDKENNEILNETGTPKTPLVNEKRTNIYFTSFINDDELNRLYESCDCLIAASWDEGFGLPIIEALSHQKAVLARDIAVFREVGGENALYFKDNFELYDILKALCNGDLELKEPTCKIRTYKDCARDLLKTFGIENE